MREGTEAIKKRILDDARKLSEAIVAQAEEKAQQIIGEVRQEIEESRERRLEEGKRYAEESAARALADAQVEYRRTFADEKDQLFEEICSRVLGRLREYSEKEGYLYTLKDLVIEAGITLGGGDLIIYLNERDKDQVRSRFLREAAEKIEEATHIETSLEAAEGTLDSIGGVVVSRRDENVSVDNTFKERLGRIKNEERSEVYRILFGE